MAEYIDRESILKRLSDDLPYKASVKRVLIQAPTADVVPKSEVERLLDDFQRSIRADSKVGMSAGEILLHINNMLIELKKKYTEGTKNE